MRHKIATLLLISLVLSTMSVLLLFRQALEPAETIGAPAPRLGTARAYVSDLNTFLRGGDLDALMQNYGTDASVRIGERGTALDRTMLETTLLAIRSTYPDITVSLGNTRREGDTMLAELAVNASRMRSPEWIELPAHEISTPLIESFRIEAGVIVEHRSSLLGLAAVHVHDSPPSEMRLMLASGLTMSRMTLSARQNTFVPVPGPATLFVREGRLEVAGGAADYLALSPSHPFQALVTGVRAYAGAGALIVSTVGKISIRNTATEVARIDVVALPTIDSGSVFSHKDLPRTEPDDETLPLESRLTGAFLAMPDLTVSVSGIVVTPVARSVDWIGIGAGTLQVALVSIPSGMSVRIDDSESAVVFMPIQGASSEHLESVSQDGARIVQNAASEHARLLVARYAG